MEIKLITYNIDGLPEILDLNDLPWILKPITWIYKAIKKTTIVRINDNVDTDKKMKEIGQYFINSEADIIGVQEDFNYHKELTEDLYDKYSWGTYSGGFDLKNIFKSIKWFPKPRFKADGINLFAKTGKVSINSEVIIPWNKSYGYIDHANDKLTTKGFRYYNLLINGKIGVDVYVVHMDADFYHPENCHDISGDLEARKSQLNQLVEYIKSKKYNRFNPIIIIGDTNSYNKYNWDKENIEINLIHNLDHEFEFSVNEAIPNNYSDCDRIFYINHCYSNYKLQLEECHFNKDIHLSDHFPLIATFNIN